MNIKNMLIRSASGIIYIAAIVAATVLGSYWFIMLIALLAIWATIEFDNMVNKGEKAPMGVYCIDILTCVSLACSFASLWLLFPFALLLLLRAIYTLYDKRARAMRSTAYSVMSFLYIGMPLLALGCIEEIISSTVVLIIFCALWINDTGAYLVGCMIGKHKLFERISPKKTWEGFFGGLLFNVAIAMVIAYCFPSLLEGTKFTTPLYLTGAVAMVSIFGTFGDLFESLLKRKCEVKDSGNLIPGHGGILDRIDSLLFVAPIILFALLLLS